MYKKIILFVMSMMISLPFNGSSVKAQSIDEPTTNVDTYEDEIVKDLIINTNENHPDWESTVIFTLKENGVTYISEVKYGILTVKEKKSGELIAYGPIETVKSANPLEQFLPRAGWSGWGNFNITESGLSVTTTDQRAVTAVIFAFLTVGLHPYFSIPAAGLSALADWTAERALIKDGKVWVRKTTQAKWYSGCEILGWFRFNTATENKKGQIEISPYKEGTSHSWWGDPNDFTQPSLCRTLTGSYPY